MLALQWLSGGSSWVRFVVQSPPFFSIFEVCVKRPFLISDIFRCPLTVSSSRKPLRATKLRGIQMCSYNHTLEKRHKKLNGIARCICFCKFVSKYAYWRFCLTYHCILQWTIKKGIWKQLNHVGSHFNKMFFHLLFPCIFWLFVAQSFLDAPRSSVERTLGPTLFCCNIHCSQTLLHVSHFWPQDIYGSLCLLLPNVFPDLSVFVTDSLYDSLP